MSSAVTPAKAASNYRRNYVEMFGGKPPKVDRPYAGIFRVKLPDGYREYTDVEFEFRTGFLADMNRTKGE